MYIMIKETYKPGKDVHPSYNKNNYKQTYYWFGDNLLYKGYNKIYKYIGYQERYTKLQNKGIKYIL